MSGLMYIAADTVGFPLHMKDSNLWGADRKSFELGPFRLSLWITVQSNIVEKKECGMFVVCSKRLNMYVFITPSHTRIAVFDRNKVPELTQENMPDFGGGDLGKTLTKLGPAIKGWYQFDGSKWAEMSIQEISKLWSNCN